MTTRTIVITASESFDGATTIPANAPFQPGRAANAARVSVTYEAIGRLGFNSMLRTGLVPEWVIARALSSGPVVLEVRTLSTEENAQIPGGADVPAPALDQLVRSVTLKAGWSRPVLLGASDAVKLSGPAGTVEIMRFEASGESSPFDWLTDDADDADDDCCESSSITVDESGELAPWTGTLFVFVDSPDLVELRLPELADVTLNRSAVVVPVGAGVVGVGPAVGQKMNGLINYGVTFTHKAVQFWRRELTWAATHETDSAGVVLTNANTPGLEVAVPAPDCSFYPVQFDFQVWGFLRLPGGAGAVALGTRIPLIRQGFGSIGMVGVRPPAGQRMNGIINRIAYIPEDCHGEAVMTLAGWTLLVSGRNAVQEVPSGAVTIAPFAGTKTVRLTEAGAQAVTLPSVAECEPNALLILESVGGTKTASRVGADVINGKGAAAATSIVAATGVNLYLRPSSANTWSAV